MSYRQALATVKPAFLYTVPSYHNPTGRCSTEARRRQIVELAREHDFQIVADEPYQLLYFNDAPPRAYGTMTESETVVSLGSFSKILAPGMRLGWIQTSDALREKIMDTRVYQQWRQYQSHKLPYSQACDRQRNACLAPRKTTHCLSQQGRGDG